MEISSEHHCDNDSECRERWTDRGFMVLGIFITIALYLGIAYWWSYRAETVTHSVPAGEIINAHFTSSVLEEKSRVETTTAVYLVYGVFQAIKGNSLTLEERKNGDRMLCDRDFNLCKKLID